MVPGNPSNQVWLTAAVCSRLMLHGKETEGGFEAALDFARRVGWRVVPGLQPYSLGVADRARSNGNAQGDRPRDLRRPRALSEGCPGGRQGRRFGCYRDGQRCALCGLAAQLFEAAFPKLLANQADDGGWTTRYGDHHRPSATVEAMYFLKLVTGASRPARPELLRSFNKPVEGAHHERSGWSATLRLS